VGVNVGRRSFVIRGAVLSLAALALGACGRTPGADPNTGADAGVLTLEAFGGPFGSVAADVPLDEPGAAAHDGCGEPVVAGPCQLTVCQIGGPASPVPGYGDFGPLSATVGMTTMALSYNTIGYPTVDFPASVALGTGGVMTFHGGDGVSIPIFDISATIPAVGVITSPVPAADGGAAVIATSQDLPVTWMPISPGQIDFQLMAAAAEPGVTIADAVDCTFDGASGAGVVPETLLASLKQTAGSTLSVYASLGAHLQVTTMVEGLTIVTRSSQSDPRTVGTFAVSLQ